MEHLFTENNEVNQLLEIFYTKVIPFEFAKKKSIDSDGKVIDIDFVLDKILLLKDVDSKSVEIINSVVKKHMFKVIDSKLALKQFDIVDSYFEKIRQAGFDTPQFILDYAVKRYADELKNLNGDLRYTTDSSGLNLIKELICKGNLEAIYIYALLYKNQRNLMAYFELIKYAAQRGHKQSIERLQESGEIFSDNPSDIEKWL